MSRNIFYITGTIVYFGIFISRRTGILLPGWINGYVTDLLALPLILSAAVIGLRRIRNNPFLFLNWKMILFAWIYISVVFEYILPAFSSRYTADPMDAVMYFIGMIFFLLLQPMLLAHSAEAGSRHA